MILTGENAEVSQSADKFVSSRSREKRPYYSRGTACWRSPPGRRETIIEPKPHQVQAAHSRSCCSTSGGCRRGDWPRGRRGCDCPVLVCPCPIQSNRSCGPECCTSSSDTESPSRRGAGSGRSCSPQVRWNPSRPQP